MKTRSGDRTVDVATPVPGGYTRVGVDLFFRQPNGQAWHPYAVTQRFEEDTELAGLPPIRLHDGRHAAATYLKAAGGDLLDMKKKLGHASITVTGDTYPAGLDEIDRILARRVAELVPRQGRTPARPTGQILRQAWDELLSRMQPEAGDPVGTRAAIETDHSAPDSYPGVRFTKTSLRAANYRPGRYDRPKTQSPQRYRPERPTDSPAPTSQDPAWPPIGRRRDRYPHDLR